MFVWIDLNVLMYHALSLDRRDLEEMKKEIQTVREKLNEGTDFISPLEIVILLYGKGLSAQRKKINSFRSSRSSFFLPVDRGV